jgi:hypothetical protein
MDQPFTTDIMVEFWMEAILHVVTQSSPMAR